MHKLAAYAALVMAAGLLGLQVVGAVEYTQGGTLYARASVIAALVTVAALPVFIEAARHVSRLIALALFVAFVAMLGYSLPAQIGRAGEVKASKATASEIADTTRQDLTETRQRLKWATDDWQQECRSGAGKQCRSKGQTVEALRARAESLSGKLAAAPAGDVASETLAWATVGTVSAETFRRSSILMWVLGLDVSIWALIWFATKVFASRQTVSATVFAHENRPATSRASDLTGEYTDEELDELRRLLRRANAPLTNNDLARLMGVTKGEASKRATAAVAAGYIQRRRVGREVAISLH